MCDLLIPTEIKHTHGIETVHNVECDMTRLEKSERKIWAGPCSQQLYRLEKSYILNHDVNLIPPSLILWPRDLWICIYHIKVQKKVCASFVNGSPLDECCFG